MKLLYCVVVLGLIQCGLTAIPEKSSQQQQQRQQKQLIQLYIQEMHKLDREQFAGYEKLFKKLLQDDTIKRGSTPPFRHFKKNANQFLKKYPRASDSELSSITFDTVNIVGNIKNYKDVHYILLSFFENGIGKIFDNYMKNFVSVVKDKFMPKFEEYQKLLTPQQLKGQEIIMEWFKDLKNCTNYDCYSNNFKEFPQTLNFNHL